MHEILIYKYIIALNEPYRRSKIRTFVAPLLYLYALITYI